MEQQIPEENSRRNTTQSKQGARTPSTVNQIKSMESERFMMKQLTDENNIYI